MNRACSVLAAAVFLLSTSAALPDTIEQVKSSANWMQVTVEGILTYAEPDECYIEATDRSGGIWVQAPTVGFEVGDPVIAIGTFSVVLGEPIVLDASVYPQGQPAAIRPFGMKNAAVGGASKWSPMWIWDYSRRQVLEGHTWTWHYEWAPACGASNTGLLVKTWGTVKSLYYSPVNGASWLYVDDGSGVVSDLGDIGVLVYTDAQVNRGDFVSVQGISSCEPSRDQPDKLIRVIRTRDAADVVVLKEPEPAHLFSDEFDQPTLDQRWLVVAGDGFMSTSTDPGWLAITAQRNGTFGTAHGPQLIQYTPGDWDLEIKIREQLGQALGITHSLWIMLKASPFYPVHLYQNGYMAYTLHGNASNCGPVVNGVQLGHAWFNVPGDTCYLRFHRRSGIISANLSSDGSSYLPQDVLLGYMPYEWLSLWPSSTYDGVCATTGVPFTAYIDYVRFTPVGH